MVLIGMPFDLIGMQTLRYCYHQNARPTDETWAILTKGSQQAGSTRASIEPDCKGSVLRVLAALEEPVESVDAVVLAV